MKRYETTPIKTDKSGIRVYSTTYYPDIPLDDSDEFISVIDGDRVDLVANRYYGDVSLWWVIAKANGIKGKAALTPGDVLRIPGNINRIIENFNNLNGQVMIDLTPIDERIQKRLFQKMELLGRTNVSPNNPTDRDGLTLQNLMRLF